MNEVLTAGFGHSTTHFAVSVDSHDEAIMFTAGGAIKEALTDPLMTDNGKSVGERNIEWLHEKLDEWIKKQLEKNT